MRAVCTHPRQIDGGARAKNFRRSLTSLIRCGIIIESPGNGGTNMRVWRNWQTRMVQVHVKAISCRFKSCYPHQRKRPPKGAFFVGANDSLRVAIKAPAKKEKRRRQRGCKRFKICKSESALDCHLSVISP